MSEHDNSVLAIGAMAQDNTKFRDVIWTGQQTQLVLMAIPVGGEIGGETHDGHDQLLFFDCRAQEDSRLW